MIKIGKITRRQEYKQVSAKGLKQVFKEFVVIYQFCPTKNSAWDIKVGYTATKKIGKAVDRNRCKRLMKALIHEVSKLSAPNARSIKLILIARPGLLKADFRKMLSQLSTFISDL